MTKTVIDFSNDIQLLKKEIASLKSKRIEKGEWETENTNELKTTDEGIRVISKEILFVKPFDETPEVFISLTGVNAKNCKENFNLVFEVAAKNITQKGFTIDLTTWAGCLIQYFCIQWLAYN